MITNVNLETKSCTCYAGDNKWLTLIQNASK